ncbi:MAG: hypothetical protein V1859_03950 [archaeon]
MFASSNFVQTNVGVWAPQHVDASLINKRNLSYAENLVKMLLSGGTIAELTYQGLINERNALLLSRDGQRTLDQILEANLLSLSDPFVRIGLGIDVAPQEIAYSLEHGISEFQIKAIRTLIQKVVDNDNSYDLWARSGQIEARTNELDSILAGFSIDTGASFKSVISAQMQAYAQLTNYVTKLVNEARGIACIMEKNEAEVLLSAISADVLKPMTLRIYEALLDGASEFGTGPVLANYARGLFSTLSQGNLSEPVIYFLNNALAIKASKKELNPFWDRFGSALTTSGRSWMAAGLPKPLQNASFATAYEIAGRAENGVATLNTHSLEHQIISDGLLNLYEMMQALGQEVVAANRELYDALHAFAQGLPMQNLSEGLDAQFINVVRSAYAQAPQGTPNKLPDFWQYLNHFNSFRPSRLLKLVIGGLALLTGCSGAATPVSPPQQPSPAPTVTVDSSAGSTNIYLEQAKYATAAFAGSGGKINVPQGYGIGLAKYPPHGYGAANSCIDLQVSSASVGLVAAYSLKPSCTLSSDISNPNVALEVVEVATGTTFSLILTDLPPQIWPTATPTTAPTATAVPPTATPAPVYLPQLSAYLIGVGEHGAMVCLKPASAAQLEQIVLTANISQGGSILDRSVSAQDMGANGSCFEVVDAMYKPGLPVSVEVNASAQGRTVQNGKQVVDVGKYGLLDKKTGLWMPYPWINYLFWASEANGNLVNKEHNEDNPFYARDLWFGSSSAKNVGIPVHVPAELIVMRLREMQIAKTNDPKQPYNYNLWLYSPRTGFTLHLQHIQPGPALLDLMGGKVINDYGTGWPVPKDATSTSNNNSIVLAYLGPKDARSGISHLHIEGQNPLLTGSAMERFFGYANEGTRGGYCPRGVIPPCEGISNFEVMHMLLNGVVRP